MTLPVTKTKVVLPRLRSDLLSRSRLLKTLEDYIDSKLIILSAPAGYGKTSLLIDFAYKTDIPVCWYSIDALDQDPYRFIAHLIASISRQFPEFGGNSNALLLNYSQTRLDLDQLATTIVNEIYDQIDEHFLILLDDFHLVDESKGITYFLNKFVQDVGENCHILISTRTLLTLPDLPLMVARFQVTGLSFEELAFNPQEIQELALQNYQANIPLSTAEELQRETEGWITGLLLSTQDLPYNSQEQLRIARVSGVNINDFMSQQVLERQPAHIQEFLLRTSLLGEFNASLCRQVFGPGEDWSALIRKVLHDNLFVLPVGERGEWIRYHHIFQDFLMDRFKLERLEERDHLLRKMVKVYAQRKEWEKAYGLSRELGDENVITHMIERWGSSLIKAGRLVALANWIDALPKETQSEHPNLLSLRGVVYVMQGHLELGLNLFNQAEDDLGRAGDPSDRAQNLARRAHAHRFLGDYQTALRDAHEALSLAGDESRLSSIRADSLRAIGASKYHLGQLDEAVDNWSQALTIYRWLDDGNNIAMVLTELGLALMSAGRYQESLDYYRQSLDYWKENNNLVRQANVLNNLGVLYHCMGVYDLALQSFEQGLEAAKKIDYSRMESFILNSIGDLYCDLEAYNSALQAYQEARQLASKLDNRFLVFYADLAEAEVHRRTRQLDLSRQLLESLEESIFQAGSALEQGKWNLSVGKLKMDESIPHQAIENLGQAVQFFEKGGQSTEAAMAYFEIARAHFAIQDKDTAQVELERSLVISQSLKTFQPLLSSGREAKDFLVWATTSSSLSDVVVGLLEEIGEFEDQLPVIRRKLRPHTHSVPFAPPGLSIRAFDKTVVNLDGEPVSVPQWKNQKIVREMFFLLLAHPEGMTREEIGIIFWPDVSSSKLKIAFKNAIYRLRQALGQNVVVFEKDRYRFNYQMDYVYDVEVFESNYKSARAAQEVEEKITYYRDALDQYQGEYFPEAEGNWAVIERERYRQMYVEILTELAKLHLEANQPVSALQFSQRLLIEDPCSEPAHRLAMKSYAALGNRAKVTRQFELCRQVLQEEANLSPSQKTRDLYEILRG